MTDGDHELGRLQAQVETLIDAVQRVEDKLDRRLDALDSRVRRTERAVTQIRSVGGVLAAAWSVAVVVVERWLGGIR